ncbi:unnamed protein product [Mytilus edulis]|uniref:Uncharacterized protein n=1 Tax=Mytilus edulis TaxID=6550 RepID=A0A8S3QT18_MYTED|nr:unnamed protein product [Mytilus edulis]
MSGTADLILVLSCNAYQVFANIITVENNNISQLTQLPTTSSADRERNIYLVLTGQHAAAHYSATVRETAAGHQDHQKKTATSFDPSEVRPFPKAPPLKNLEKLQVERERLLFSPIHQKRTHLKRKKKENVRNNKRLLNESCPSKKAREEPTNRNR